MHHDQLYLKIHLTLIKKSYGNYYYYQFTPKETDFLRY